MNTGLVFKITGETALVLESGGQFRKVPAQPGWKKGDTVRLSQARRGTTRSFRHLATVAAGVALMISLTAYACYHYLGRTVTYVSVDVNPSIELGLNSLDWVVSSTAFNGEGESALQSLKLGWMSVEDALDTIISSPEIAPYLEDSTVVVAVSSTLKSISAGNKVTDAMRSLTTTCEETSFVYRDTDWDLAADAHEDGVSMGKKTLALQIQEYDEDADVDELVQLSTSELMDMLHELQDAE